MAEQRRRRPPAKSPEARERELISLTTDLVEKQLREGTASAAVMTHYLKLATQREAAELQRIKGQVALDEAKIQNMASGQKDKELYENALKAFSSYQTGNEEDVETYDG